MTADEITKIAKIMLTADSWCSTCQGNLFEQLREAFPEHNETINAVWSRREQIAHISPSVYRGYMRQIETDYRKWEAEFWDSGSTPKPSVLDL